MLKLNRRMEYALMALKLMAAKRQGRFTSVREVCVATGAPFDVTARVLQVLASQRILRSEQGVQGGYVLTRDLSRFSLFELSEIVEGPSGLVKCAREHDSCELLESCNIRQPLQELNARMAQFLRSVSVGDVLGESVYQRGAVSQEGVS
jgi:Rrf2 family protein